MVNEMGLHNGGIIREINEKTDTSALYWTVEGTLGIFSFWISTQRTNSTLAATKAGKRTIYINLDGIEGNQPPNKSLKELGDRSVIDVLKLLEEQSKPKTIEAEHQLAPPVQPKPGNSTAQKAKTLEHINSVIQMFERQIERENREKGRSNQF
jgi:hypothetical protein